MYFGSTRPPLSNTNILQGTTSFRLQAASYALKFAGHLRRNWRAMPLPITPTVFTVFTIASTRCSSRSPSAILTAICCLSVVPTWMPSYLRLPVSPPKCGTNPHLHVRIPYPDLGYRGKREALVHQE